MRTIKKINQMRIVYQLPRMEQISVRKDITYKTAEGKDLQMDIYYPDTTQLTSTRPAVIFVHGGSQPEHVEHIRDAQQYVSWCQLIALSGWVAVMFEHRADAGYTKLADAGSDVEDLFSFIRIHGISLGINPDALGIWTCSSGSIYGASMALRRTPTYIRCVVAYYGGMTLLNPKYFHFNAEEEKVARDYSPDELLRCADAMKVAPFFIARAGLDRDFLNKILDDFVKIANKRNIPLTLMNHPTGEHGFDIFNDNARSREIIKATLAFLSEYLTG